MTGARPRLSLAAIVVGLGLAAGVGALVYSQNQSRALQIASATAAARPWELKGEPCPAPTGWAADPAYAPNKAFIFNDIRFSRRTGHADCNAVAAPAGHGADYFPLCQFTGPSILAVTTPKGVFKFAPEVGKPATVWVLDGVARCVVAANATF